MGIAVEYAGQAGPPKWIEWWASGSRWPLRNSSGLGCAFTLSVCSVRESARTRYDLRHMS